MSRPGTDTRVSKSQILGIRFGGLKKLQKTLESLAKSRKEFPKQFKKTSSIIANAYRRWAATYAPLDFGVLDKPDLVESLIDGGKQYDIIFNTEYAGYLEEKEWGPDFGHPYRTSTRAKQRRLGTPIGPHYAERAQKDFQKWLQKNPPRIIIDPKDIFTISVAPPGSTPMRAVDVKGQIGS